MPASGTFARFGRCDKAGASLARRNASRESSHEICYKPRQAQPFRPAGQSQTSSMQVPFMSAAHSLAAPPPTVSVTLRVNGASHTLSLDPRVTLLDALREHLHLTGSKKGCDQG